MEKLKEQLLLDKEPAGDANDNALLEEFMRLYGGSSSAPEAESQNQNENLKFKVVEPHAGFCIKTKSQDGNGSTSKVFLNICTADHIPSPQEITDEELADILSCEDPSKFRVPMSLGEPHAEVDKSGNGCIVYDIVISQTFFNKISSNNLFMGFFMSVVFEGLDNKYDVKLSSDWIKLKNKKQMGKIMTQHIRTESKPWIVEMDSNSSPSAQSVGPLISEVKDKVKAKSVEPKYKIVQEPTTGHPDYLIAEIDLPEIRSSKAITLDIGEDCIVLNTRSLLYSLHIYLPYSFVQTECGAQFDKQSKKLSITLPVVPQQAVS